MADFIFLSGLFDQALFEQQLTARFPAVAADIDDHERGLLHLEMAVLARFTGRAIEQGCVDEVGAHFAFVDELFSKAAPDLENAIYVSYLENVFIGSEGHRYQSARAQLSERLKAALAGLEIHWQNVVKFTANNRQP